MKTFKSLVLLALICYLSNASAQRIDVKEKARNAATNRADQKVDNTIDKSLDKIEEGIGGLFKKKNKSTKETGKDKSQKRNDVAAEDQQQPSIETNN